jgi:acetyltransferase-like isoleucine patch superfamily enzyme
VVISSNVNVGTGCIIGTGAMIRDGVSIGANTMIGIGSVVTKDIPAGVVAYGNPCNVVGMNEKWKLPHNDFN